MADQPKDSQNSSIPLKPVPLIGQKEIVRKIEQLISKCKASGAPFPHTLLIGEDEIGERAMADAIADKMGTKVVTDIFGSSIPKAGHLIGILTNSKIAEGDILFVREIHRLSKVVEEFLYPAMEQFLIDFVIDKGPYAKEIKFQLKRFTLIATAPEEADLSHALREKFLCIYKLGSYSKTDLLQMLLRETKAANVTSDGGLLEALAEKHGDNTTKALRVFRKALKYLELTQSNHLTSSIVEECSTLTEHGADSATSESGTRDRSISEEVLTFPPKTGPIAS